MTQLQVDKVRAALQDRPCRITYTRADGYPVYFSRFAGDKVYHTVGRNKRVFPCPLGAQSVLHELHDRSADPAYRCLVTAHLEFDA